MDQVLLVLATVLGDFLQFVGGPDQAVSLIGIFEKLCCTEDVVVRNSASVSITKILGLISPNKVDIFHAYYEMYQRLCNEDGEVFYGRMSASLISADIYRLAPAAERAAVLEIYGKLVTDEMSMVRKAAGQVIIKLTQSVTVEATNADLSNLMKQMLADEHASVKCLAFENLGVFCVQMKRLNLSQTGMLELAKVFHIGTEDPSWKIRHALAKSCKLYPTAFAASILTSDIFPGVITLAQDPEPDVRISALDGLALYLPHVGLGVFSNETAALCAHLLDDPVPGVRKALADACVDMAVELGKTEEAPVYAADAIVRLIQDEDPMVRLRVLKNLGKITRELPSLCQQRLTVHLVKMFKDGNWRVRKEIGHAMSLVIPDMGYEYFKENFLGEFLPLLKDDVDEVRSELATSLSVIAHTVPEAIFVEVFLPSIRQIVQEEYLKRLCILNSLSGLLYSQDYSEPFRAEVLQLIAKYAKDAVPNVRLKVAQLLGKCREAAPDSAEIKKKVHDILNDLCTDKDKDVKYFAEIAQKQCRW